MAAILQNSRLGRHTSKRFHLFKPREAALREYNVLRKLDAEKAELLRDTTNALSKSIKLAQQQTQRDLQQSYLMRAALEAEKLKTLIEEIAKQIQN